jgi:hypothetical protein
MFDLFQGAEATILVHDMSDSDFGFFGIDAIDRRHARTRIPRPRPKTTGSHLLQKLNKDARCIFPFGRMNIHVHNGTTKGLLADDALSPRCFSRAGGHERGLWYLHDMLCPNGTPRGAAATLRARTP